MFGVIQRRLPTQRDWEYAWRTPIAIPNFVRDLGEPGSLETNSGFQGAVHYLAGYLDRFEFRLFRNGGLPLIERRTGDMIEEIIVRAGSHSVRGTYIPMCLQLHISHEGLREVRERYWPTSRRPPISLVSGNVGLIQNPPTYDIWNVATEDSLPQITQHLRDEVLPYLDMLSSPSQLRRAIFDGEAAMFDHSTALEWLLTEFGRADAKDYIRQVMEEELGFEESFWNHHSDLQKVARIGIQPGDPVKSLAVIAYSHDLCRRWLY